MLTNSQKHFTIVISISNKVIIINMGLTQEEETDYYWLKTRLPQKYKICMNYEVSQYYNKTAHETSWKEYTNKG